MSLLLYTNNFEVHSLFEERPRTKMFVDNGGLEVTGVDLYQLTRGDYVHLLPNPCSGTLKLNLEIDHGRSIYIPEVGQWYKSVFLPPGK